MPILLKKGCPVSSVYHIKRKEKKRGGQHLNWRDHSSSTFALSFFTDQTIWPQHFFPLFLSRMVVGMQGLVKREN